MTHDDIEDQTAPGHGTTRRTRRSACGAVLMLALAVSVPPPARADRIVPPDVPQIIRVPAGNRVFRAGHAVGTQDYVCLSTGWASPAFGPQATLFNDDDDQIITHFLSPNPQESNTPRPTWQDSRDTSTVWGNPIPGATYTLMRPPFRGFSCRSWELRPDPPAATGWRARPISSA